MCFHNQKSFFCKQLTIFLNKLLLFCHSFMSDSGSSVRFPRQEYWSGLPFPSPMNKLLRNVSYFKEKWTLFFTIFSAIAFMEIFYMIFFLFIYLHYFPTHPVLTVGSAYICQYLFLFEIRIIQLLRFTNKILPLFLKSRSTNLLDLVTSKLSSSCAIMVGPRNSTTCASQIFCG